MDRSVRAGLAFGALGVLAFSFTLPATRLAVGELDPLFVSLGRAALAGVLALLYLGVARARRPEGREWRGILLVAIGVVFGWPTLTTIALTSVPASHAAVVNGLLPVATAVAAVLRGGERPSRRFWVAALVGTLIIVGYSTVRAGGSLAPADLLLFGGVGLGALGYAEGGRLAARLGGARVISWALLVSLPVVVPAAVMSAPRDPGAVGAAAWAGFGYVAVISMFLGFFAWYRGLAIGGVARVAQLQLLQPLLTLAWSALFLAERIDALTFVTGILVILSVAAAVTARVNFTGGPSTARA